MSSFFFLSSVFLPLVFTSYFLIFLSFYLPYFPLYLFNFPSSYVSYFPSSVSSSILCVFILLMVFLPSFHLFTFSFLCLYFILPSSTLYQLSSKERNNTQEREKRSLPPGKGSPVPIGQEAGRAPELVWTQRLEENIFASAGDRIPVMQSVVRHCAD
jgi:hypothetical protein